MSEQGVSFQAGQGSGNRIEFLPGGFVALGPSYDRESLARIVAHHITLPLIISRGPLGVIHIDSYCHLAFPCPDYASNSEVRAFFERVCALRLALQERPEGTPVQ